MVVITKSSEFLAKIDSNNISADAESLARRHSLSLSNRTPPRGSIAEDLLQLTPRYNLNKAADIIDKIKESISDFGSCLSDMDTDCSNRKDDCSQESLSETNSSFKSGYKKIKKKKRKKSTPDKDLFVKKPNLATSTEVIKLAAAKEYLSHSS